MLEFKVKFNVVSRGQIRKCNCILEMTAHMHDRSSLYIPDFAAPKAKCASDGAP